MKTNLMLATLFNGRNGHGSSNDSGPLGTVKTWVRTALKVPRTQVA